MRIDSAAEVVAAIVSYSAPELAAKSKLTLSQAGIRTTIVSTRIDSASDADLKLPNVGFGGALNAAFQLLDPTLDNSWYLMCNDDLVFEEGAISEILRVCNSVEPGVGLIGFKGSTIDHRGRPSRAIPHGSCWAVRSDAFRRVGGFDVSLFLYGEEVDLCSRINLERTILDLEGIQHHGGASTGGSQLANRELGYSSFKLNKLYSEHRAKDLLERLARMGAGAVRRRRFAHFAAFAMGVLDGLRGVEVTPFQAEVSAVPIRHRRIICRLS